VALRLLEVAVNVAPSQSPGGGALVAAGQRAPTRLVAADSDDGLLARAADMAAQSRPSRKTRQDYAGVYNRLIGWLVEGLGRAPYIEDLTLERLLAWRNYREQFGGRRGEGLAPASMRVEVAAVRVLLRQLGLDEFAERLSVEGHQPAPPETITPQEYDRLLRMPDRRSRIGIRDHAVLRVLGEAGLRSAELRGLRVRHLERARSDSPHRRLRVVRGKRGRGRVVDLTASADDAVEAWLARHPAALPVGGGRRLPPEDAPLFCTLGRLGRDPGRPLSAGALNGLITLHAKRAGIAAHLRHPHVLRAYWATRHASIGTPIHRLRALGGWGSLRTLVDFYLAAGDPELAEDVERFAADAAARARERGSR
jgi:integrase/recombinase XerD